MVEKKSEQATKKKDVSAVDEKFLDCRDIGHSWVKLSVTEDRRAKTFTREVACSRCSTERVQVMDLKGYILKARYRYVTGYLLDGAGRLTADDRAIMRLRNLRRSIMTSKA